MKISDSDVLAILRQYNPWWSGQPIQDLPSWRRAAFGELKLWMTDPPAKRAILLSGARQIGKTTLMQQVIAELISEGAEPESILYATFDHPLLKIVGIEGLMKAWEAFSQRPTKKEYFFFDEIQYTKDWEIWLKHQVDFNKNRRIAVTGSAMPLSDAKRESGVGRWHTIRLATLSFYEYLQIKNIKQPPLPKVNSLMQLLNWKTPDFVRAAGSAQVLIPHFHDYLLRGGFPQTVLTASISTAQKLLREDIVDKVLKRDMTAFYGVRNILELERTFLYICMHGNGIVNMGELCGNLEVAKPTALSFINLLEAAHLIYRLPPFGYGKEILRGRFKVYLADPGIAPSVLLRGNSLLADETGLGTAAEAAVIKHIFSRYYAQSIDFSYWKGKDDREVDLISNIEGTLVPFEVKYRSKDKTNLPDLKGLLQFCAERKVKRAYVMTKDADDLASVKHESVQFLKIPAALACYFLGQSELSTANSKNGKT